MFGDFFRCVCMVICVWDYFNGLVRWFVFGIIFDGLCLGLFSMELSDGFYLVLFSVVGVWYYFR